MRGMGRLVKNEIIKIWKQKGYKIIIFIILGFMLIAPVFNVLISSVIDYSVEDEYNEMKSLAETYEDSDPLESKYYSATANAYKFFIDNNLGDSWKYEVYSADYIELYLYKSGLELLKDGKYTNEEVADAFSIEIENGIDIAAEYLSATAKLQKLENDILKIKPEEYYKQYVLAFKAEAASSGAAYKAAKAKYDSAPDNEAYKSELRRAEAKYETDKINLKAWELLSSKSAAPNGWQYTLAAWDIPATIDNYLANVPVSKNEYNSNMYESYDAYVDACEDGLKHYKGILNKYIFAIENGIELQSEYYPTMDISAKSATRNQVESFISMFSVIMIIMLAGSIAKEFSNGTVRLLLIRPRTRTQIIVSKLLAVLIIFAVLTVAVLLVTTLEYMLLVGVDDMFVPDILMVGENIMAIPSFVITLIALLIAALPTLAYSSVAAVLAASTKKAGMSITLPLLMNMLFIGIIVSIASILMSILPGLFSWIEYSPIVYFNMSFTDPSAFGGAFYSGIWLGAVYHIVFIAIMVWLTLFAYKKSEVKG